VSPHPLLDLEQLDVTLAAYLDDVGEVFAEFLCQDSGNRCYGVRMGDERWFVKHGADPRTAPLLEGAREIAARVRHAALPALHHHFETREGPVLVYAFVDGEVIYNYPGLPGEAGRRHPKSAHARFRGLPPAEIAAALDVVFDLHLAVAAAGMVAVDFYDGSILYDFEGRQTHVCDLDHYQPGAFVLEGERLAGSTRFMAPEEFQRGARIDQVTNVFTLGRTALVLLGDGSPDRAAWRGSEALREVALRASADARADRYPDIPSFVGAWRSAAADGLPTR
jgi:serine/threonine-protein kinase